MCISKKYEKNEVKKSQSRGGVRLGFFDDKMCQNHSKEGILLCFHKNKKMVNPNVRGGFS